jgi:hypothetical protein
MVQANRIGDATASKSNDSATTVLPAFVQTRFTTAQIFHGHGMWKNCKSITADAGRRFESLRAGAHLATSRNQRARASDD